MLTIISGKCVDSFPHMVNRKNKLQLKKKNKRSVCQTRISKYANAEEDGRKYNTDGTDLTNTVPVKCLKVLPGP